MLQGVDNILWNVLALHQVVTTCRSVEQHIEFIGCTVGNCGNDVGVHHVMNERNVLVADSLNVVLAKTVFQHGWALKGFDRNNFCSVLIFQMVTSTNRSCGTSCTSECCKSQVRAIQSLGNMFIHRCKCTACYFVVAKVVSEFAKLIEDEVLWIFLHFVARIVNFLHVAFRTRRTNDVARVACPAIEPVETLL